MKKRMQILISLLLVISFAAGINATGLTGEMTSQTVIPEVELDSSEKFYEGFNIDAFTEAEVSAGVMTIDGDVGESTVPDSESYDVYALLEFDYPDLDLSTLEGLDVEARRDAVRDYYKPRNEQIVAQLGLEGVTVSYSAPFADISFDSVTEYQSERDELIIASDNSAVEFVGVDLVSTEEDLAEESATETTTVPVYPFGTVKNDVGIPSSGEDGYLYDGTGIKVGILERGFPEDNSNFFENTIGEVRAPNNVESSHTTMVASIISGSTGIAKESILYCAFLGYEAKYTDVSFDIISCLNWLMNEKYVNIINMSCPHYLRDEYYPNVGDGVPSAIIENKDAGEIYTKFCAYIDYVIATNACLIVKSAGNEGEDIDNPGHITKPAMAVNVLTVGSSNANKEVAGHSSYVENEENIHKPEVVAPGENILVYNVGTDSGTSFAAPVVTGIAARLMEEFPVLKTDSALLKNVIMAGCDRLNSTYDWLDDKAGFGLVNYTRSRAVMQNDTYGTYMKYGSKIGEKIYESAFSISSMNVARIKLNRMVLGENCALTNDEVTLNMTQYRVVVTATVWNNTYTAADFIWDDSIAYFNYANTYNIPMNCKIEIYVSETSEVSPAEYIAVAYTGATHQHLYTASKTVHDDFYHSSFCTCGEYIREQHSYPEDTGTQRYCTECNYPEGSLGRV